MSTNETTKKKERLTGFDIVVGFVVVLVFGALLGAVVGLIKCAAENEGAVTNYNVAEPKPVFAKVGKTAAFCFGTSEDSAYFVVFNPTTLQKGDKARLECYVGGRKLIQTGTVVDCFQVQVPGGAEGETDDLAIIEAPYFFDDAVFNIHSNDSIRSETTP